MDERPVATAFLRNRGEVLLLRRSEEVGSYQGRWGAIAGHVETDDQCGSDSTEPAVATARREIREETGIDESQVSLVRAGEPFPTEDDDLGVLWVVHPFLFACDTREVTPNYESTDVEWTSPTAILDRETVPRLWTSYDRVRPRVDTVENDTDHGASHLSIRALEVLRDEAALSRTDRPGNNTYKGNNTEVNNIHNGNNLERDNSHKGNKYDYISHEGNNDDYNSNEGNNYSGNKLHEGNKVRGIESRDGNVVETARELLSARPSMTVIANRINRVLSSADRAPASVEEVAHAEIESAIEADVETANRLASHLAGKRVATLSRSGTVHRALTRGSPEAILVAESRPGGEGREVAHQLRLADAVEAPVSLTSDAAFAYELQDWGADVLAVGADSILADGSLLNKVGTRSAALACAYEGIEVFVGAATDKIRPDTTVDLEPRDPSELSEQDGLDVLNPTFDVTPPDVLTVVTERGVLETEAIRELAAEHARQATWDE